MDGGHTPAPPSGAFVLSFDCVSVSSESFSDEKRDPLLYCDTN